MPVVSLDTNLRLSDEERSACLEALSAEAACLLGKPESYVMVRINDGAALHFAASDAPCAYLEFKSIGLTQAQIGAASKALCKLLERQPGIPAERIYIEFSDIRPERFGWNGQTF
ncbi:MAG: phenylpyruvate tautomerase MIF-related protein [Halothiobacillaceae bacterium]|jgi:phenylpyruvate tautomerase PptA (4-oxalocrotonate tautomerase family)|nr:phenylpyruvate tautomerase MIF-related protein [Halothiobacillaceae bacterium]MDY0049416.1 phenylpyruvate tautomerase MIF-related protein [Halothiobacillaceae bacterium]